MINIFLLVILVILTAIAVGLVIKKYNHSKDSGGGDKPKPDPNKPKPDPNKPKPDPNKPSSNKKCEPPCSSSAECVNGKCKSSTKSCSKDVLTKITEYRNKDPQVCNFFTSSTDAAMNNNADLFSCCSALCGSGCCLWPGCVSCGFDKSGRANKNNVYLLFLNDPVSLAEFFVNISQIDGTFKDWTTNPGTFPMFSNEVSHDWFIDGTKQGITSVTIPNTANYTSSPVDPASSYIVYGTPAAPTNPDKDSQSSILNINYDTTSTGYPTSSNPSKLCGAMKWRSSNGYLCGTFDGFGMWRWSSVVKFLIEFSRRTGIQELGVYDAQFLMPHWFNEKADTMKDLFAQCKSVTPYSGVKTVPLAPGGETPGTYELKLHLYLGGWPSLNVEQKLGKDQNGNEIYDATIQAEGLWKDVCLFCKQNVDIIKYVYMDVDASGIKVKDGTVQSKSWLTSSKIAELGKQLLDSTNDSIVLGAVITANPIYGFLPNVTDKGFDVSKYMTTDDQPGGQGIDPSSWVVPSKSESFDGNNSYCQDIIYGGKSLKDGCPNSIQNAIYVMQQANNILKNTYNKNTLFTRFIQDGENNGTATSEYCVWWNSIAAYMGKGVKSGNKNINNIGLLDMKDVVVGQAFSSSTNTGGISDNSPSNCGVKLSNFVALPELYWYTDLLKNGLGKNFDSSNQYVKNLVTLLKQTGSYEDDEITTFLKDGAGCEGCDHNHVAPARQVSLVSDFPNELKKGVTADSGWPEFIAAPSDPSKGVSPCTTVFKSGVKCDDKTGECDYGYCTQQNKDAYLGYYGCTMDCIRDTFGTVWYPKNSSDCTAISATKYGKPVAGTQCGIGADKSPDSSNYCQNKLKDFMSSDEFKKICPAWPKNQQIYLDSDHSWCETDSNTKKCACKLTCDVSKNPSLCATPPSPSVGI